MLRSWKEGKEEDSSWRWTMPSEQAGDFNHYIGLMNGVNRNLGPYIVSMGQEVEKLTLRDALLSTIVLWQWNAAQLAEYIQFETKEPVTESEYRERERKAREELKPVAELAGLLVERREDWAKADLEPDHGDNPHDEVIVETYRETLRAGVEEQWRNLGAVAQVIADVGLEFDGEDPALPELRSMLDHMREKLAGLHDDAQRYVGLFELPDASEDEVAWVHRIVEREG